MREDEGVYAVELTPMQRGQMAALIKQLESTRVVAENFVSYFAKELGVDLRLYQFDAEGLAFVPVAGSGPATLAAPGLAEAIAAPIHANGASQEM